LLFGSHVNILIFYVNKKIVRIIFYLHLSGVLLKWDFVGIGLCRKASFSSLVICIDFIQHSFRPYYIIGRHWSMKHPNY